MIAGAGVREAQDAARVTLPSIAVLLNAVLSTVNAAFSSALLDTEEVRSSILLSPTIDSKGSGDFILNPFSFP